MGMYVVLTAYLFQRGSSESKPIDQAAPQDKTLAGRRTVRVLRGRYAKAAGC